MVETLEALIARVEKCTGPDREIDQQVWQMFDTPNPIWHDRYTASLDAVVALVEWEFPEHSCPWTVRQALGGRQYYADIEGGEDFYCEAYASTPALALLLAFLRAKAASPPRRNP